MSLSVIILAAGKGTRMYSGRAKVLHEVGGKPMLKHVIDVARGLSPLDIHVVIGHQAELVQAAFPQPDLRWTIQAEQLGTGHAVQQAIDKVVGDHVLVLYGDVPLIQEETLLELLTLCQRCPVSILTVNLNDPTGYGRILRNEKGDIQAIVEQADADSDTLRINEGNTGILIAQTDMLKTLLANLKNHNEQGEYYLTDCIEMAVQQDSYIGSVCIEDEAEVLGVNNPLQLEALERRYQERQANRLLLQGVILRDKSRFDLRGKLHCGRDVVIDVNCLFEGDVRLGNNVQIGANCVLKNCEVGDDTVILENCVLEQARLEAGCSIGPFARLRPGAHLCEGAKAGNFVEVKKSRVGRGSKVNHLTYIGDSEIGENVNIGAGTITCNYDGVNKHQTIIGDDAFIGSNTALVAPVEIEAAATIGAGSTITKTAPAGELTLSRSKQLTLKGWSRPVKGK